MVLVNRLHFRVLKKYSLTESRLLCSIEFLFHSNRYPLSTYSTLIYVNKSVTMFRVTSVLFQANPSKNVRQRKNSAIFFLFRYKKHTKIRKYYAQKSHKTWSFTWLEWHTRPCFYTRNLRSIPNQPIPASWSSRKIFLYPHSINDQGAGIENRFGTKNTCKRTPGTDSRQNWSQIQMSRQP